MPDAVLEVHFIDEVESQQSDGNVLEDPSQALLGQAVSLEELVGSLEGRMTSLEQLVESNERRAAAFEGRVAATLKDIYANLQHLNTNVQLLRDAVLQPVNQRQRRVRASMGP
ncbi:hypothetical protein Pan216_56120 [Planctomycetes bacterium Pan216]|uniref:Chromosome partition protein Smc n=1 Tax=Kolteria novifilia TaxID=2527975 RepID=A0A518BCK5_9BACT|nr:hypothetical protein Pan216_56120 [Planctomycetes bacterium Pan216]